MGSAWSNQGNKTNASLLGLPRELRLEIYDHLRLQDYNHTTLAFGHQRSSEDIGNVQPSTNIPLSWNSLSRTCRTLHTEITSHVAAQSTASPSELHTIELELDCGTMQIHSVVLHRVPCPPSQVQEISVHLNARKVREVRTRGDGGLCPVVGHMWHTLRRLVQNGPLLDDRRPLAKSMPIRDLVVEYDCGEKLSEADEESLQAFRKAPDPRKAFRWGGHLASYHEVVVFAKSMVSTGVLSGYMEKIIVRNTFFGEEVIAVPLVTGGYSIPDYWQHHGFWWVKPSCKP